ncbi:MAG TPA: 4-(cytidine 5'-diphospho)-2-C-methyl-D-erythritol kinase [Verrucomicrobiae bacterium]|jgi:4-diphosphocytidyl-2-C-methyl-D-erythritol kinase
MLSKASGCKVNLLLNVLGKRADGYNELETVMHPVDLCDRLDFERAETGIRLSCSDNRLPTNSKNLAHRAAALFLQTIGSNDGIRIHLHKQIPIAAGLGGGSGNAAVTLLALNELFGHPLEQVKLGELAASLGSDIPFFLQENPAIATGRGEIIAPLAPFPTLSGTYLVLVHPGFGISTPWAYAQLSKFPAAAKGEPGRAQNLVSVLQNDLVAGGKEFYNSLEAPALHKYPFLALVQENFRENGAIGALMSGSGSTTFALARSKTEAEKLLEKFKAKFGVNLWTATVKLAPE